MKTIAFYLPQFHEIPENNDWWGKGFTEWTNVKKAHPLFANHYQPRIPLDDRYYDLTQKEAIDWQARIARSYGIDGFCIYHYWFDGHLLLQKPLELLLQHPEIDIEYCICWANEDWTNAWVDSSSKTLISQNYGGVEEWDAHFRYLYPFLSDRRYIRYEDRPFIVIYRPEIIPCLNQMLDRWQELAKISGLAGLCFAYQHPNFGLMKKKDASRFDFQIDYEPAYSMLTMKKSSLRLLKKVWRLLNVEAQKKLHRTFNLGFAKRGKGPMRYEYDEFWKGIIKNAPYSNKSIPCGFADWDNTPRRGEAGSYMDGASPKKFERYLTELIANSKQDNTSDMLFLFAWNEWGEGGYLEPDERFGYGYLEAVRNSLIANDGFRVNASDS